MRTHQITTNRTVVKQGGGTKMLQDEGRFEVYYLDEDRAEVTCGMFKFGDGVTEKQARRQASEMRDRLNRDAKAGTK